MTKVRTAVETVESALNFVRMEVPSKRRIWSEQELPEDNAELDAILVVLLELADVVGETFLRCWRRSRSSAMVLRIASLST